MSRKNRKHQGASRPGEGRKREGRRRNRIITVVLVGILAAILASMSLIVVRLIRKSAQMRSLLSSSYTEPVRADGRTVLFISSYEPDFVTVPEQLDGIRQTLYRSGVACVTQYMDSHLDSSPTAVQAFHRKIRQLMQTQHFSGVIIADDPALNFAVSYRDELFGDLPIVFIGANNQETARRACRLEGVTGFLEVTDLAATIRVAAQLLPAAEEVVGVIDNTPTDQANLKEFIACKEKFPQYSFRVINAAEMTRLQLGTAVRHLSRKTILLYISCFQDGEGNVYTIPESASYISENSLYTPVFRSAEGGLGNGVIGGRIVDFEKTGQLAVRELLQGMDGRDLSDLPLDTRDNGVYRFDYDVMQRFNLSREMLPADAQIENYSLSYWDYNRDILVPLGFAVGGLLILLALVQFNYIRSRRFADQVAVSEQRLREVNENLHYVSDHDELTGLLNRFKLDSDMEKYLRRPVTVLFCDMDNFKFFNDTYGHHIGDEILKAYARVLRRYFNENDCYRYGGDEFLLIVPGGDDQLCRGRVAAVQESLSKIRIEQYELHISCSCGCTWGEAASRSELLDMIRIADIYIYEAKAQKKEKFVGHPYERGVTVIPKTEKESAGKSGRDRDALTGFGNMNYFLTRAREMAGKILDFGRHPSVLFFNIEGFRRYNEVFGYDAGDELLQELAGAISEAFPSGLCARFSDDHFVVLVYRDEYDRRLGRIMGVAGRHHVHLRCGICELQEDLTIGACCDRARIACESIRGGKVYIRLYTKDLDERLFQREMVLSHLSEAIAGGEIQAFYQSIVRACTLEMSAEEAVVRWVHPGGSVLQPEEFVPILESAGEMYRVDLAIVRQVISDFQKKREAGLPLLPVSLNLSYSDFEQRDMVSEISAMVHEAGVDPKLLRIELQEGFFTRDLVWLRDLVRKFHEQGFEVWLDHFGGGFSSLSILQSVEFDQIKLDMHTMQDFSMNSKGALIFRDVIGIARKLDMHALAENVENREQFRLLQDLGCEKLQGFYFDSPRPVDQVIAEFHGRRMAAMPENPDEAAYFDQIGMTDLHDPFRGLNTSHQVNSWYVGELPAGIVEIRSGICSVLVWNGSFYRAMRGIGVRCLGRDGGIGQKQPPRRLQELMKKSLASGRWEKAFWLEEDDSPVSLAVHRVAVTPESEAVLVVLLMMGQDVMDE